MESLAETVLLGGLAPSSVVVVVVVVFGLLPVLGSLVVFNVRAAFVWFVAFVAVTVLSVLLPEWIAPRYAVEGSAGDTAFNIVVLSAFSFAVLAYFVRQRDAYQKQSDDLLHNILPDEIAARLKTANIMIADHCEAASVLFADVVDFTPMSAGMSPTELVGLRNHVFTTFDGFVEDLGLETMKTVGDEYMVAAGVPVARSDHAIAELALRIRDYVASNDFDGHKISLRIGLNSGQVVAGIIGLVSSPTTSGVTRSTWQAGWSQRALQGPFR